VNNRLLILIFACSLVQAGPWEDRVRKSGSQPSAQQRWTLCVRPGLAPGRDLLGDEAYQKLVAGGDWTLETLSAAQAQDLQTTAGAAWALLAPRGEALLQAVHGTGARARWEVREAFLREHPAQGEALLEALGFELRLLRAKVAGLDAQGRVKVAPWHPAPGVLPADDRIALKGAGAEAMAEDLYAGMGETLGRLSRVHAWTRQARGVAERLALVDLGQAPSQRRRFQQLAPDLEALAVADPEDGGLLQLWLEAQGGAGQVPGTLAGKFTPVPGTSWPAAGMVATLLEPFRRREDWAGQLRCLAELTSPGPPEPLTVAGWESWCQLQGALLASRAAAFTLQGSLEQAQTSLDAAVTWGGLRPLQGAFLRRSGQEAGGALAAWRRMLARVAGRPSEKPVMPPQAPPLRLVLLGRPPWLLAWTALRDAPDLAPWAPGELRWEIAGPDVHLRERARFGWDAQPRWALFRGEELLESGGTLPAPPALAARVAAHGTPLAQRLGNLLAQEPGHLAARRARFELLRQRMPDPRLEPLLVEDAVRGSLALPFTPEEAWKPDPALWGAGAQAVLPDLEAQLRSWPTDAGLWRAWISWARFHPARPAILDLARSLPYWTPLGDWRTTLPAAAQEAVAAELWRQGRFLEMRDWFQAAWDQLDHRPLKELRPWERALAANRHAEEEATIFKPLRAALRALGQNEQLLELERTFGAMMGKDARSR
jgi:hypothetical protein